MINRARLSVTYLEAPITVRTINGVPEPMLAQIHFPNHRNRGADVHWEHGLDWVKKEIAKKAAREKALKKAKKA
jgi:hypothetical protein